MNAISTVIIILLSLSAVSVVGRTVWLAYHRSGENPLPPKVREASHVLANETTKLQAATRSLARANNPLAALVEAMHEQQQAERNGGGGIRL